jgi:hypothetical protein
MEGMIITFEECAELESICIGMGTIVDELRFLHDACCAVYEFEGSFKSDEIIRGLSAILDNTACGLKKLIDEAQAILE